MIVKQDPIEAGYRAFNGHIFSQVDAGYYNNSVFHSEDEKHRTFIIIIGLYNN